MSDTLACPMHASDVAKWVQRQPWKTSFHVRGWCHIDHPVHGRVERLMSSKVTRAQFVVAARHLAYPNDVHDNVKLPIHVYVDGDYRAAYLGV